MTSNDRQSNQTAGTGAPRPATWFAALAVLGTALMAFSGGPVPFASADDSYEGLLKPAGNDGFETASRVGDPVVVFPPPPPETPVANPPTTDPPAASPPATDPPAASPPNAETCDGSVPSGTTFGASNSSVGQSAEASLRANDELFGRVPIVREFYPRLPATWDSSRGRLLRDREVVLSFKATPQAVLSGKHDSFFRNWFATAPEDRTIYWSFHHEPEGEVKRGDFTAAQYRAAWKRLDGFADAVCKPNMHATLILSAWAVRSQADDWHEYDAGKDVIDVVAFDPYNRIFQPGSSEYDSPEQILGPIVTAMNEDGRPFGLAELGSRVMRGDSSGQGRAQWLRSVGEYAIANDFTFVSYFQSTNGADWRLLDPAATQAWSSLVARSPR